MVCFTERDDAIRIISSRKATRKEQNNYEGDVFNGTPCSVVG
ncbi:MAG: BrnT family toxin [Planctomycetes bacterium]|nr:BrnT family toxin [Planctomycetota bacterium]